ncbi:MAG: butyrate kinase [Elusimicrobia bacterium CG08_land_8_20_14_0_20_51_18]|nr:MAG: butyrate kinase [Elusimicrobia bacterium CG08_land_8_20_14_0_20_51_18]
MSEINILVINPGSTSDEVSFFKGRKLIFHKVVRYSLDDLKPFEKQKITAQFEMRKNLVIEALKENNISISEIQSVIGRGGVLRPIESGTYEVDDKMAEDLKNGSYGDHSSNLGGLIAKSVAEMCGGRAFIADPVVVDELDPLARYSGMPENPRVSILHALNQKRVARHAARQLGKPYEDCNLIVLHGGGGISVGAHRKGRIVDVNNALDGEGPFTPQRSGGVPAGGLAKMCFSGKYTLDEIKLKIKGKGGLAAYTGTSDIVAIKKYVNTGEIVPGSGLDTRLVSREKAKEVLLAMAYQISKEISSLAGVFEGKVDAIVMTGGIVYDDEYVTPEIRRRVQWIAPVIVYPGGDEMTALRLACESALKNPKKIKKY